MVSLGGVAPFIFIYLFSFFLQRILLNIIFKGNKSAQAAEVGKAIAEAGKKAGIETVVFDRGGYLYHGRVKALAEGAREGGLKF